MTVKEFLKMYCGDPAFNVQLYDIIRNESILERINKFVDDSDIHDEWKKSIVDSWDIEYDLLWIYVKK